MRQAVSTRESERGRFRSWGEAQIARCLTRHGVSYLYEHPLAVVDEGKTRIWYPDFQLAGYGVLIEYCGRVHDPNYAAGIAKKRAVYAENGLTALMFAPEVFRGAWPEAILGRIQDTLTDRLARFQTVRSRIAVGGEYR